jgi:hypothetical protein
MMKYEVEVPETEPTGEPPLTSPISADATPVLATDLETLTMAEEVTMPQLSPAVPDDVAMDVADVMASVPSISEPTVAQPTSADVATDDEKLLDELPKSLLFIDASDMKNIVECTAIESYNYTVSLEKRVLPLTRSMIEDIRVFLQAGGFPVFVSHGHEAEAMCATLTAKGVTEATVTEDLDAAVFADSPVLRYFQFRNRPITEVSLARARDDLGLSRDAFLDFCILCGTDFNAKVEGIGAVSAYRLIQKHGSIESVVASSSRQYAFGADFLAGVKQARRVFRSLPDLPAPVGSAAYNIRPETSEFDSLLERFEISSQERYADFHEHFTDFTNLDAFDDTGFPDVGSETFGESIDDAELAKKSI